ncbi:MAG: hypothetical protein SF182_12835 [Deltaproteobacteria bacterium]|nr:hypothetical protein [Deltaproteobacteria bacterium]
MRYYVRWTFTRDRSEQVAPRAYSTITQALDSACDVISLHRPADIWVVDDRGDRRAVDFEVRSYRRTRRQP